MILLMVVVFRFFVFMSYIHIKKAEFRENIISSHGNSIVSLEMPKADLFKNKPGYEWKEGNRELVINGVYHEVIAIKSHNSGVLVLLVPDRVENDLFSRFFRLHKKSSEHLANFVSLLLGFSFEEKERHAGGFQKITIVKWLPLSELDCTLGYKATRLKPPTS